jgi:chromate transport protein ChrA
MYGLSLAISNVGEVLPAPAFALLSGLNAATVGIIALAAVRLSQKAISDKISRLLVFLGATAGLLYNALWYFPVLILSAGLMIVIWDFQWLHRLLEKILRVVPRTGLTAERHEVDMNSADSSHPGESKSYLVMHSNSSPADTMSLCADIATPQRAPATPATEDLEFQSRGNNVRSNSDDEREPRVIPIDRQLSVSWKFGALLIAIFFMAFTTIMVLRGVIRHRPLLFSFFSNMYLAGTIIFGGGPVVVPLLRQ